MVDDVKISFDPYSNYDDLCECLVFFVNRTWVLRGTNEPCNLLLEDIGFKEKPDSNKSVKIHNLRG